jgi:glucose/arabinose dehydrogenase
MAPVHACCHHWIAMSNRAPAGQHSPPGFPALLFTPANRPFTIVLLIAVVGLAVFLYLDRDTTGSEASGTTVASTAATTIPGPDTGTAGEDTTSSTIAEAATTSSVTPPELPLQGLALDKVADGFTFPVFAIAPPGDERIFVAERAGMIRIVDADGDVLGDPFLDISDRIDSASGVELGLLGVAFHPGYATNGRFFVHYTDLNADTVLAEYAVSSDPAVADPASEKVLLFVDQVGFRHRGGMIQFGPDGYLYMGLGDGTDMNVNPQNLETLQGSILRLDVNGEPPYTIPQDNPFATSDGKGEIWAYGLRNPWRFSIDPVGGRMYIGDVGEESWEEIDSVALSNSGANFGWPFMEGSTCFTDAECGSRTDLIRPIAEYAHENGQCAVTGGYVYRGAAIPEMTGHYFYADWCAGWVKSFVYDGENATQTQDWTEAFGEDIGQIDSFGVDGSGELLVVMSDTETVYRIVPVR